MKIFRYIPKSLNEQSPRIGLILSSRDDGTSIDLSNSYKVATGKDLSMLDLISGHITNQQLKDFHTASIDDTIKAFNIKDVELLCPLDKINSLRDAYAFRQHVETSRKNRGLKMIEEFDNFPIYYYSNHNSVNGPGVVEVDKIFLEKLDYELEIAIIIGKKGINISTEDADSFIFGFTIMNDLSSRQIQMEEMKLNLGPAKGKDFATSLGPYISTKDEIEDSIIKTKNGNHYDIELTCKVNNKQFSSDNLKNMHWTFAQIIAQISKGTWLYPGDVIGSGTCATGCFYEINSAKNQSEQTWLQDGDSIEISTNKIGILQNQIKAI